MKMNILLLVSSILLAVAGLAMIIYASYVFYAMSLGSLILSLFTIILVGEEIFSTTVAYGLIFFSIVVVIAELYVVVGVFGILQ